MDRNAYGNPPVISETIRKLVNQGRTTNVELADLAGISDSAVGRYAGDQCGPSFETVRLWCRLHPDVVVRRAFAACLQVREDRANGDINNDGVVDINDVVDGGNRIVKEASNTLDAIREVTRDGEFSRDDVVTILNVGSQLRLAADRLVAAAEDAVVERRHRLSLRQNRRVG